MLKMDLISWAGTFACSPISFSKPSALVTLVQPSAKSVEKVKEKLKVIWRSLVGNPIGCVAKNSES